MDGLKKHKGLANFSQISLVSQSWFLSGSEHLTVSNFLHLDVLEAYSKSSNLKDSKTVCFRI